MKIVRLLSLVFVCVMVMGSVAGFCDQSNKEQVGWPKMAITINSSRAGTSVDASARVVAKYLTDYLKTNVIVNNTSGQVEAARDTLTADPDGYTICFTNNTVVINDVAGATDFDSVEDLDIVAVTSQGASNWIAIRSEDAKKWGVSTLNDLYAYCEANPGELLISSQQNTNTAGATSAILKSGMKATPADAGSTNERLTIFLAGDIDIFVGTYSFIEQYVEIGEVLCLASCSRERTVFSPNIPSTYELGYEVEFPSYYYVSAPKGLPDVVLDVLGSALEKMVNSAPYAENIKVSSQEPYYLNHEKSTTYLKENKQHMIDLGMGSGYKK